MMLPFHFGLPSEPEDSQYGEYQLSTGISTAIAQVTRSALQQQKQMSVLPQLPKTRIPIMAVDI